MNPLPPLTSILGVWMVISQGLLKDFNGFRNGWLCFIQSLHL
jgi:hypothetical protein